jgi:protein-glucosylgalactosylhydroxylysine glucosidase
MRILYLLLISVNIFAQKIDRKAVVERHKVVNRSVDTLSSLSVGNGHFAFTVDATGLQTFPMYYAKGIPLGTQSSWSWHSFPNSENFQRTETYRSESYAGRPMIYALQGHKDVRKEAATDYYRANPHRIHLGHFGFRIQLKTGQLASPIDIKEIHQTLNPYTGVIFSTFSVEGIAVKVWTISDPKADVIYAKVQSDLLKQGRLHFQLDFPFLKPFWMKEFLMLIRRNINRLSFVIQRSKFYFSII